MNLSSSTWKTSSTSTRRGTTVQKNSKYYLLPGEEEQYRTVQNKNHIGKVMFLTAMARPRYDDKGNCTFDGKIGAWAFIRKVPHLFHFLTLV
jgi:hypothetical protein